MDPFHTLVRDALASSVGELFLAYGVTTKLVSTESTGASTGDREFGSIIGFTGANIRGGLAFVAPVSLLATLLPVPPGVRDDEEFQLRDWSAEIANQLVGRLKNKLIATHDLDFAVGTPVCFRGKSVRLVFLPDADGLSLTFSAGESYARIHIDVELHAPLELEPRPTARDPVRIVAEGDVILF